MAPPDLVALLLVIFESIKVIFLELSIKKVPPLLFA